MGKWFFCKLGAYDSGHVYTYVYKHNGGAVNISIYDDNYGDNVNLILHLNIQSKYLGKGYYRKKWMCYSKSSTIRTIYFRRVSKRRLG